MTKTTRLDGFRITAGYADDGLGGGGLHNGDSSLILAYITFFGNTDVSSLGGGALYNGSDGHITLNKALLTDNSADQGGGIYNEGTMTLTNAILNDNEATTYTGGGIYNDSGSSLSLTNVTLSKNSAESGGGALSNNGGTAVLTNCVLSDNSSSEIYNGEGGNTIVSYSNVQNSGGSGEGWNGTFGTDGGGNIDAPPSFVDANGDDDIVGTLDDDLRLEPGSLCIDVGTEVGAPLDDFEGQSRPWGAGIDMGADELVDCYDIAEPYTGVDAGDIQAIAGLWRQSADHPPYDIDGDGITTVIEVMKAVAHWGQTCP